MCTVRNGRDLLPVDPAPGLDVPEGRQHVHAAIGQLGKVSLESLEPERVVDREGLRLRGAKRHLDEWLSVGAADLELTPVRGEASAAGEIAEDDRVSDR